MPIACMVAVTLFAAGCGRSENETGDAPPPIEIRGSVLPAQSMTITAQVDGVVENVAGAPGTRVEAGALVAQLSNAAVERDAAVARAQLQLLDARMRRGSRVLEHALHGWMSHPGRS